MTMPMNRLDDQIWNVWLAMKAVHAAYEVGIYQHVDHLEPGQRRVVFALNELFDHLVEKRRTRDAQS